MGTPARGHSAKATPAVDLNRHVFKGSDEGELRYFVRCRPIGQSTQAPRACLWVDSARCSNRECVFSRLFMTEIIIASGLE